MVNPKILRSENPEIKNLYFLNNLHYNKEEILLFFMLDFQQEVRNSWEQVFFIIFS